MASQGILGKLQEDSSLIIASTCTPRDTSKCTCLERISRGLSKDMELSLSITSFHHLMTFLQTLQRTSVIAVHHTRRSYCLRDHHQGSGQSRLGFSVSEEKVDSVEKKRH